jgi:hypothetical protein
MSDKRRTDKFFMELQIGKTIVERVTVCEADKIFTIQAMRLRGQRSGIYWAIWEVRFPRMVRHRSQKPKSKEADKALVKSILKIYEPPNRFNHRSYPLHTG